MSVKDGVIVRIDPSTITIDRSIDLHVIPAVPGYAEKRSRSALGVFNECPIMNSMILSFLHPSCVHAALQGDHYYPRRARCVAARQGLHEG